jgi:hypothetical protein
MKVVLHKLHKRDDGSIQIGISFSDNPIKAFNAIYDGEDPKFKSCTVDQELFMQLSDLAHRKYGNCAVYQIELMNIISAFVAGDDSLVLPATLGTTKHCRLKPSKPRVFWNKLLILLYRIGLYRPHFQSATDGNTNVN